MLSASHDICITGHCVKGFSENPAISPSLKQCVWKLRHARLYTVTDWEIKIQQMTGGLLRSKPLSTPQNITPQLMPPSVEGGGMLPCHDKELRESISTLTESYFSIVKLFFDYMLMLMWLSTFIGVQNINRFLAAFRQVCSESVDTKASVTAYMDNNEILWSVKEVSIVVNTLVPERSFYSWKWKWKTPSFSRLLKCRNCELKIFLEGGSGWGTRVHPWRIHVDVWQNQDNIVE